MFYNIYSYSRIDVENSLLIFFSILFFIYIFRYIYSSTIIFSLIRYLLSTPITFIFLFSFSNFCFQIFVFKFSFSKFLSYPHIPIPIFPHFPTFIFCTVPYWQADTTTLHLTILHYTNKAIILTFFLS